MNQPLVVIVILIIGIFSGLALLAYGLSKSGEGVQDENDPNVISFRIHVRNPTEHSKTIESGADFTISERVIMMIRECAQGHVGLSPLVTSASTGFTIPAGQSRDYRAILPRIPKYEQLLELGNSNLCVSIRVTNAQTISLGTIPFKHTEMTKYYMDVNLSQTQ